MSSSQRSASDARADRQSKGQGEEIAGVVSGDRRLEAEGKRDLAKGRLKKGWESLKRAVRHKVADDRPSARK